MPPAKKVPKESSLELLCLELSYSSQLGLDLGGTLNRAWNSQMQLQKNSGSALEMLLEQMLELPSSVRLALPKPWKRIEISLLEHFQNGAALNMAGTLSSFGRALSWTLMRTLAVRKVPLRIDSKNIWTFFDKFENVEG